MTSTPTPSMSVTRSLVRVAMLLLLIGILSQGIHAQEFPAWEPNRTHHHPVQQAPVVPAQYYTAPLPTMPVDAISDFELSQMAAGCEDPVCVPAQISPYQWSQGPSIDPVLANQTDSSIWKLEVLPSDVIWQSYMAGAKEPRISGVIFQETSDDLSLLDVSLGGRTSVLRYGARRNGRLEGWELQLEGAGILRLNLDNDWDFDAADFRFGVPLIYAYDKFQYKFSYYHLSSHVGDEFLERYPDFTRINYTRDCLVFGVSYFPLPAWRWYAETGFSFYSDGGAEPWEFQFGLDYAQPGPTGLRGTPFVAINGHLREEVDFGGNFALQAGWLWRGEEGRALRTGFHYFNGKSSQFEFFDNFEQQIGWGLWQEF